MNAMTTRVPFPSLPRSPGGKSFKLTLQSAVNHNQCPSSTRESLAAVGHTAMPSPYSRIPTLPSWTRYLVLSFASLLRFFAGPLASSPAHAAPLSLTYCILHPGCTLYSSTCYVLCRSMWSGALRSWGSAVLLQLLVGCVRNHSRGARLINSYTPLLAECEHEG